MLFNANSSSPKTLKERIAGLKKIKQRETVQALNDISLHLKAGDRVGILGHNGAGKTTILKIISNIYKPSSGSVEVKGRVSPLIEIGAGFHPELTGRENLFLYGSILGIPKKDLKEHQEAIIEFSELKDSIDSAVKYYSTGMSLRLAFSILTEFEPDILILDELFVGLDRAFISKASQRLDEAVSKSKILITVTHQEEYLLKFCNEVIILKNGVINFRGAPDKALEIYSTLQNL